MSDKTCPVCNRRQDDGLICHHCCVVLETELVDVPNVVIELGVTLARQGRGEVNGKSGLAHTRAGYHSGASLAAGVLNNTLTTWARDISGETWVPEPPQVLVRRYHANPRRGPFCLSCSHSSCDAMRVRIVLPADPQEIQAAAYLLGEITAIRRHAAANELHDQVVDSIRQARHATDRAVNRTIIPVGPCPEEDEDGTPCPGEVFAFIPTEDDRPSRMECKVDASHKYTAIQWMKTGKRILDVIEKRKQMKGVA